MSNIWRTLLVISLGLGVTWAAGRIGGGPPSILTLADTPAVASTSADEATAIAADAASAGAGNAPATAAAGAAPAKDPAPVEELSQADIDAELRNVEKVLGGGVDPGEEAADKPLPADLGVALPSDI